jgi:hypothetical protein
MNTSQITRPVLARCFAASPGTMSAAAVFAMSAAAVFAMSAAALATDIAWNNDAFSATETIAPGKVVEKCGEVDSRTPIQWKFSADGALEFNIHRHEGKDVIYTNRSYNTRELRGTFKPNARYEWCWMWTNDTAKPVTLRIDMKRE